MSLSQVASEIAASPTLALNEKARLLRVKGEPVIHLGAGEPKNRAPIAGILGAAGILKEGMSSIPPPKVYQAFARRSSATRRRTTVASLSRKT